MKKVLLVCILLLLPIFVRAEYSAEDVFDNWSSRVVLVICQRDTGSTLLGSGVLITSKSLQRKIIYTNAHVIEKNGTPCLVVSPDQSIYFAASGVASNGLDFGYLEPSYLISGQTSLKSFISPDKQRICEPKDLRVGAKIYILGYPVTGGDSITMTDGIISGYQYKTGLGRYIKTSAKIEHGNSGGAAILADKNCYFGIPSRVARGELDSIGYILDITPGRSYINY